jgi:hypothetical protein
MLPAELDAVRARALYDLALFVARRGDLGPGDAISASRRSACRR